MKTSLKLTAFIVGLTAVLAVSFGVGNAVGPVGPGGGNAARPDGHDEQQGAGHGATEEDAGAGHVQETGGHGEQAGSLPGGLLISEDGYTLEMDPTILGAGHGAVTFRVTGPDGEPVTDYRPTHDKDLHFIAVRRDLSGFQHVHPTIDESGTWSTSLDLTPGAWRFFADFQPAEHDETLTLGVDAAVAGPHDPQPLPPASRTAQVDDYTVTLEGHLTAGEPTELRLTVSRDGEAVTDLQPYLAAYGHLVALRAGDLAYLHVHPDGEPGDGSTQAGPGITFHATAPTAGTYRLFLDFKHDDVVRTAEFTVQAPGPSHTP